MYVMQFSWLYCAMRDLPHFNTVEVKVGHAIVDITGENKFNKCVKNISNIDLTCLHGESARK